MAEISQREEGENNNYHSNISNQNNITNIVFRDEDLPEQQDQIQCRICLEGGIQLIAPCKCTGSIELVHYKCLKQWLEKNIAEGKFLIECELCKERYIYWLRNYVQFVSCDKFQQEIREKPQLLLFLSFIILLSIGSLTFFLIYFLDYTKKNERAFELYDIEIGLLLLGISLSAVFMAISVVVIIKGYAIVEKNEVVDIDNKKMKTRAGSEVTLATTTLTQSKFTRNKVMPINGQR